MHSCSLFSSLKRKKRDPTSLSPTHPPQAKHAASAAAAAAEAAAEEEEEEEEEEAGGTPQWEPVGASQMSASSSVARSGLRGEELGQGEEEESVIDVEGMKEQADAMWDDLSDEKGWWARY